MKNFSEILCHGTILEFDEFDLALCQSGSAFGRGFYFTNDISLGRQYSSGLDPVVGRVTLTNPYFLDRSKVDYSESLAWSRAFRPNGDARERLIAAGYDGVLFVEGTYVQAVAFYPEQIESFGRQPSLEVPAAAMSL